MERQQQRKEEAWVIWNISMCPIPDGVDPSVMGTTIQKALESAGHVRRYDQISITAFGNNLIKKERRHEEALFYWKNLSYAWHQLVFFFCFFCVLYFLMD